MFVGTLDPASTRADWESIISLIDSDTDEPLDIAGASLLLELRERASGAIVLTASTANGRISIVDTGTFRISLPVSEMRALRADTYEVGGICTLNGTTRQFIIGLLPILDGVVT
jgi:hypothetical protein